MNTPKTRTIRWFVSGRYWDGSRWESSHRHETREDAEVEMQEMKYGVGDSYGMTVVREVITPPKTKTNAATHS